MDRKDKVFCLPHQLLKANQRLVEWCKTLGKEEVIFDLRSEIQKSTEKFNKKSYSLEQQCDIW